MKLKTTHLLNDGVISQWSSSFVQLAISTFVDQLLHTLQVGIPTTRADRK
jgi:hypothetical protein